MVTRTAAAHTSPTPQGIWPGDEHDGDGGGPTTADHFITVDGVVNIGRTDFVQGVPLVCFTGELDLLTRAPCIAS